MEEPEHLPPPPKDKSAMKRIVGVVLIVVVIVVLMLVLFVPFVEVEVSKYEILGEDCRQFEVNNFTVCELTIWDKGVGGNYTVGAMADGHRGNPETLFIGAHEVENFTIWHYGVIAYNCTFTIDAPKIKEAKSVVQILAGG